MGSCRFRSLGDGEIELIVDYGVERDPQSWLEEVEQPVTLVTGAAGFIGRYMVDLLTGLGYRVFATDLGPRPRYLEREGFENVLYESADLREEDAIFALVREVRPAVAFHVAALFDFSAPEELLHEINVSGTERVCEAASDAGVRRVVCWSTGSVYAPSEEPAPETGPKDPGDPYARSKLEGEKAAFAYHDPAGGCEVYSVRPAMVAGVLSRYGSGLVMRLMHDGYLVGPPQKAGTTAIVNARDVASCAYLVAAANLDLPRATHDDTAFNASADPVGIDDMMRALGAMLPRRRILGVPTKLAEIISFGYQEKLRLPEGFVRLVGRMSGFVTRNLNRFRFDKLHPKVPPETIPYLTKSHNMSNAKARRLLGWKPDPLETDLEETVRFYEETEWSGFEKRASSEDRRDVQAFEEARSVMGALETLPESGHRPSVRVPSLGLDVDCCSLRIMVRSAESYMLRRAYRGSLFDIVGMTLPRIFAHTLGDISLYLKHSYLLRYGGRGLPEAEALGILREVARLDRDRVLSWILTANGAAFIGALRGARDTFARLARLLPDGHYGLVVETDFGDLALELRKDADRSALRFITEEVDFIPRHLPLAERVDRLRAERGMRMVLGVRFDDLAGIISGGGQGLEAEAESFFCSPPDLLRRLSDKVESTGWTLILLEDEDGKLSLGLDLRGKRRLCSPERLEAYEIARRMCSGPGALAPDVGPAASAAGRDLPSALEEASSGREKVKIYPAAEFQKLLADATAPGVVARLLGR